MKYKRGKILIPGSYYDKQLEDVSKALACIGFVPFRVEHLAMPDEFELVGCSPCFDRIEVGLCLPEYELNIERHEDGSYKRALVRTK